MGLERLGLIKTTLLDYPGKVAAVVFTRGCNLRCPWCHNPALVVGEPPDDLLSQDDVLGFLGKRRPVLGGVVVTGGEPLYHQDLVVLLEQIRVLDYPIKLDTNGTYPRRLASLPDGLVDFVAMDLKGAPSRYDLQGIPGLGPRIPESIALIQKRFPNRQFRTTWVPGLNTVEEIPEMAAALGAGESLSLTGFHEGKTLNPAWASHRSATRDEVEEAARRFEAEGILVTCRF